MANKNRRQILILLLEISALVYIFVNYIDFGRMIMFPGKMLKGVAQFTFSNNNDLRVWEEKVFKGHVTYSIKKDEPGGYLDAYSNKNASGLLHKVRFDPVKTPMVSWVWRVTKFPDKSEKTSKEGGWLEKDDYAARFYVIFPKFPFFRLQCLEYVWDKDLALGTVLTNPSFKNLKIIVAESGEANLGKWVRVERNVKEDFKKAFGRRPGIVGAIAIMTDSDNTESTAQAQYKDIEVGYGEQ